MLYGHVIAGIVFLWQCERRGILRSPVFWLFVVYWGSIGAMVTWILLQVLGHRSSWLDGLMPFAFYSSVGPVVLIPILGGARWLRARSKA